MNRTSTVWPLAALLAAILLTPAFGQESSIRTADKLVIEIKGVPLEDRQEVSSTYVVSDAGTVHLPYLSKDVYAVGLTPSSLARAIEAAYKNEQIYTNPTIVIAPVSGDITQQRVVVAGEVRAPNQVPYAPGMTLLEAITACQGFTDFAKDKEVKLIRNETTTVHDMSRVSSRPELDPKLRPGDKIIVPQRGPFGR